EQLGERMLAELALAGRRLLIEVDRERRDRRRDAVHACIDRRQPHRLLGRRLDARHSGGYRLVDDAAELAAIIAATTLPRPPHAISLRTPFGSTLAAIIRDSAFSMATTPSIFFEGSVGFSGFSRPPRSTWATVFAMCRSMIGLPECTIRPEARSADDSAMGSVMFATVVRSSITLSPFLRRFTKSCVALKGSNVKLLAFSRFASWTMYPSMNSKSVTAPGVIVTCPCSAQMR